MSNVKRVTIPALFYRDHLSRECGQSGKIVGVLGTRIMVDLDEAAFQDLLSDADCYADFKNSREDYRNNRSVVDSAIRTLAVLKAVA